MKKTILILSSLSLAAASYAHGGHEQATTETAHGLMHYWPALLIIAGLASYYYWKKE